MAARTPMLYVGANDGLLHAFRAAMAWSCSPTCRRRCIANISKFTGQSYSHQYFADGSPEVGDAKFGSNWRTVLASG